MTTAEFENYQARADNDHHNFLVNLYVRKRAGDGRWSIRLWPDGRNSIWQSDLQDGPEPEYLDGHSPFLSLTYEEARVAYEALAEFFGHNVHGASALRKDYDHERKRVDSLIGFITGGRV